MRQALRQLTALPVHPLAAEQPGSAAWLPVVGLLVGVVWMLAAVSAVFATTAAVSAAVVLLADGLVTGGRSLHGLAAVADRRGGPTGGVVAVVLLTLLRFALLINASDFPADTFLGNLVIQLLVVPVAGGTAMVALLSLLPLPDDDPLGRVVVPPSRALLAAVVAATVVLAALVAGRRGVFGTVAVLGVAVLFGAWWRRLQPGLDRAGVLTCGLLAETVMLLAVTLR